MYLNDWNHAQYDRIFHIAMKANIKVGDNQALAGGPPISV